MKRTVSGDAPEELTELFRELPPDGTAASWTAEEVWAASRGELDPARTRELVDLAAHDAEIADAWRVARALAAAEREAAAGTAHAEAGAEVGGRRGLHPALAWVAAAAVVVVALGIWVGRDGAGSAPGMRDVQPYAIESTLGEEPRLPREAFELTWTPGPDGARYAVEATDLDLNVLFEAKQLERPRAVVPVDALEGLAAGDLVLWRVEAFLEDGRQVRSPTFRAALAD